MTMSDEGATTGGGLSNTVIDRPMTTSRALLVGLMRTGPMIPGYGADAPITPHEAIPVGLDQLDLLVRLRGNRTEPVRALIDAVGGPDGDALAGFVDELVDHTVLIDIDTPGRDVEVTLAERPPAVLKDDDRLVTTTPVLFRVAPDGYQLIDHDGDLRAVLSPIEMLAANEFRLVTTLAEGRARHLEECGDRALSPEAFDAVLAKLVGAELVLLFDPDHPNHNREEREDAEMRESFSRMFRVTSEMDRQVQELDKAERKRMKREGRSRVRVVPIDNNWQLPPAGLGLIIAYAKAFEGGRLEESYAFDPRWLTDDAQLGRYADQPAIFLLSNYVWNHAGNLHYSRLAKSLNPHSITIHGGPDTPKYVGDCEDYFAANPSVDVTVRGEGEATFAAILDALRGSFDSGGAVDLRPLADVEGLSYRAADGTIVHTPDRDRIADLDTIPSPYTTGLFDAYVAGPTGAMILETNRGCPYGCTFCDWGSATLSRIRKFDLDRIFGELEWAAHNGIDSVSIADANFGIFERDVEIAEKIADLRRTTGFPRMIGNNYAKNSVKHLTHIIRLFAEVGIVAEGVVSLQSMDEDTLLTIKRKNIKVEKYHDLSVEFRRNQLPLAVDLMAGLPGATTASMRADVQTAINRDVRMRLHATQLLPNSPMNDPAYKAEHGINVDVGEYVSQTTTYTRAEWEQTMRVNRTVLVCDMFGVLRHVAKYVRSEIGMPEIEFYERLVNATRFDQEHWPTLAFTLQGMFDLMSPPASWRLLIDEVHDFCTEELGILDDSALQTVLTVQYALQPAPGRPFPVVFHLEHDYADWHEQVILAREAGHLDDWEKHVPPLRELGPAEFPVDDPEQVCIKSVGQHLGALSFTFASWELGSPVARARISMRPTAV